jgi:hypothetical protein
MKNAVLQEAISIKTGKIISEISGLAGPACRIFLWPERKKEDTIRGNKHLF